MKGNRMPWAMLIVFCCAFCAVARPADKILSLQSHRMFEDFLSNMRISADGRWALRTSADGQQTLFDLASGSVANERLRGGLDTIERAAFCGSELLRRATRDGQRAWFAPSAAGEALTPVNVPAAATPVCSSDGARWAHYLPASKEVWVGNSQTQSRVPLDSLVMRATFSHDGRVLYVLGRQENGLSALYSISTDLLEVTTLTRDLDASPFSGHTLAVTPRDDAVIIPLVSAVPARDADRQRPRADRWLKLYRFDLRTRSLTLIRSARNEDETDPAIVGKQLYWVSSRVTKSVGLVPASGGKVRDIVVGRDAYFPSWAPQGKRIAFVVGEFRLADLPLDQDVAIADVGSKGAVTTPQPFIVGNHEDFPPIWSPNGRWIVWHSHRAPRDLPYASAPGATDDVWLRNAEDLSAPEIRLTRDLWEVGWVSWAPDGRSIVYPTWDRKGTPGIYQVRTTAIDPLTGTASGEQPFPLPADIRNPLIVEWSPTGEEFAVEDVSTPSEHTLWVVSKDRTRFRKVAVFPSDTYGGIAWFPDGKRLAFAALENKRMQIFATDVSEGSPRRLTDGPGNFMHPRVSPDGRWVAFSHIETTHVLRRSPATAIRATYIDLGADAMRTRGYVSKRATARVGQWLASARSGFPG